MRFTTGAVSLNNVTGGILSIGKILKSVLFDQIFVLDKATGGSVSGASVTLCSTGSTTVNTGDLIIVLMHYEGTHTVASGDVLIQGVKSSGTATLQWPILFGALTGTQFAVGIGATDQLNVAGVAQVTAGGTATIDMVLTSAAGTETWIGHAPSMVVLICKGS